jgi:hypothetical protein
VSGEVRIWTLPTLRMEQVRHTRLCTVAVSAPPDMTYSVLLTSPQLARRALYTLRFAPFAPAQCLISKRCDRRLNPLRAVTVVGPSAYQPDLPWTILVASDAIELWQKARIRQVKIIFLFNGIKKYIYKYLNSKECGGDDR